MFSGSPFMCVLHKTYWITHRRLITTFRSLSGYDVCVYVLVGVRACQPSPVIQALASFISAIGPFRVTLLRCLYGTIMSGGKK